MPKRINFFAAVAAATALILTGCSSAEPTEVPADAGPWSEFIVQNTAGEDATLSARTLTVNTATPEQAEVVLDGVPEFADYSLWLITVQVQKVSGANVAYLADYASFKPVTATGIPTENILALTWEECESDQYTEAFETEGELQTQCFLSASAPGDDAPAGMMYAKNESQYDFYTGTPVIIVK